MPTVDISALPPVETPGDVLLLAVARRDGAPRLVGADLPELEAVLPSIGVTGRVDEVLRVPYRGMAVGSVALVGVGTASIQPLRLDAAALRCAAGAATRQLRGIKTLVVGLPFDDDATAQAIIEGAAIGGYSFSAYKSAPDARAQPAERVVLAGGPSPGALSAASAVASAVTLVRDLVNTPANDLTPAALAKRSVGEVAGLPHVTSQVLEAAQLAAEGYGGILAAGQGSIHSPRLVLIEYRPPAARRHLALVGKGITFDTGGLSLKSPPDMVDMKYDMTGAATVLATVTAAARRGVPTSITALCCIAENMAGEHAIRPGDVIRMKGGTTVEVLNTDAEGRLVLADGLVAASDLRPDVIIDVATLTGSARKAFGFRTVPVMGDAALSERLVRIAGETGEHFLRVPIGPEWLPQLSSNIADLANISLRADTGGMLIAAAFLQHFVGRKAAGDDAPPIPWAHLDIAGPANNEGDPYGYTDKGATGAAVRTLIALADDLASDSGAGG